MVAAFGWEEQLRIPMRLPVLAQNLQSTLRQRHEAILGSLAMTNVNHHSTAVNISDSKMCSLLQPQPAHVDRRETHPVAQQPDTTEDLSSLFDAEDGGELFLAGRTNQLEHRPFSPQRPLDKELDPAQRDGRCGACIVLDILDVQEILSEFFLGHQVR